MLERDLGSGEEVRAADGRLNGLVNGKYVRHGYFIRIYPEEHMHVNDKGVHRLGH